MTKIEIDLGGVGAEAIVDRAVSALLENWDLREAIRKRVEALTYQEILVQVRPMLEEALTASLQPTDSFGKPKGEETTLREVIVKKVEAELKEAKPRDGGYHQRETLIDQIVGREVAKVVGEDLREAMIGARKKVREAVEAKGAEVLAETIARMAR